MEIAQIDNCNRVTALQKCDRIITNIKYGSDEEENFRLQEISFFYW